MDELQRKKQQMKSDGGVDGVIAAQTGSEVKAPAVPEERGSVFNNRHQKLKRRGDEAVQGGETSLTIFNDER